MIAPLGKKNKCVREEERKGRKEGRNDNRRGGSRKEEGRNAGER